MTAAIWTTIERAGPVTLRGTIIAACALLSTGAAVIHFAVLGEHWREWWGYGLFFGVAAWLQLAWAVALLSRASSRLLIAGAVANVAIALLWLVTRTGGVPAGPAFGEAEAARFLDVLATAFEVTLGIAALAVAALHLERMSLRRWVAGVALLAVAAAVIGLTTASLVDAASGDGSHDGDDTHGSSHEHGAGQREARPGARRV